MSFAQQKLSELAVSIPGATKIFREYDLDFCCGGSVLLEVAAQQKNLNLAEIEKRLTDLQQSKAENHDKDWTSASYAEMIDHIKNGYVATERDANDLAKGIHWVLDEADYASLSEAAVGKVLRSYSQRSVAMQYLEIYNEALAYKNFRL